MGDVAVLAEARSRREALAIQSGVNIEDVEDWDRLLLLADRAWAWRDIESISTLLGWALCLSTRMTAEATVGTTTTQ